MATPTQSASRYGKLTGPVEERERIQLLTSVPFFAVHAMCLFVFWVGWSWAALAVCAATYLVRVFAITSTYHRYFSHRTFKTSRPMQFVLAFLGAMSAQKGPLWWAAHHRDHHRYSDTDRDIHSPIVRGFWWSHVGWILAKKYDATVWHNIPDFARFRELRWLNEYHAVAPVTLATGTFVLGALLHRYAPELGTSAFQMLVWGFFVSTTLVYHATFMVNSAAHIFGRRRFATKDFSRNNLWIALCTLGEGWHNNHHRYPSSERQGFYWWEIDVTHYVLTILSWVGLVWDLRKPPSHIYEEARRLRQRIAGSIPVPVAPPAPLAEGKGIH